MGASKTFKFHSNDEISDIGYRYLVYNSFHSFVSFISTMMSNLAIIFYSIFIKQVPCDPLTPPPARTTTTASTTTSTTSSTTKSTTTLTTSASTTSFTTSPTPTTTPYQCNTQPHTLPSYSGNERKPDHYNPFLPAPTQPPFRKPTFCSRSFNFYLDTPIQITSPNFPSDYQNDERCIYTLLFDRTDVCYISVDFRSFSVGSFSNSDFCNEDFLLIDGVERVCGLQTGTRLFPVEPGCSSLTLDFVTDSIGRGPGFDIRIQQVFCNGQFDDTNFDGYGSPLANPIQDAVVIPSGRRPSYFTNDGLISSFSPSIDGYTASPLNSYGSSQDANVIVSGRGPKSFPDNFIPRPTVRPPFNNGLINGNFVPPISTSRPSFDDGTNINNGYSDSYGVNVAPVISSPYLKPFSRPATKPAFINNFVPSVSTSRPSFDNFAPISDSYGVSLAPVISSPSLKPSYSRPTARPPFKPSYNSKPSYNPKRPKNVFRPFFDLVNAKSQALSSIFGNFRVPKFLNFRRLRFRQKRPTARPPFNKPSYKPTYKRPSPRSIQSRIEVVDELCTVYQDVNRTVVISPNYPEDYGHQYSCNLVLEPKSARTCAFSVYFKDFVIENSPSCSNDVLEINEKQFCGQHSEEEFYFPNKPLEFYFNSNDAVTSRGFYLEVRELENCKGSLR